MFSRAYRAAITLSPLLWVAVFLVGLAASSKYNGASLILAPLVVSLLNYKQTRQNSLLSVLETLLIGLALSGAGYALGTPQALLWMAFYFKRMPVALLNVAAYARQPGSLIGLLGQDCADAWLPMAINNSEST